MRREYVEDAVLVLGGAVVIAAAWLIYWQAGLIVAVLVCMLLAILAYRHRPSHPPRDPHTSHDRVGAAAWRIHVWDKSDQHTPGDHA
jgi:hypothetical protein